jgi:hypothetical protein
LKRRSADPFSRPEHVEPGVNDEHVAIRGSFVFDEPRIPIPWDDFKATPNATLLVLNTTKGTLDAAPTVA